MHENRGAAIGVAVAATFFFVLLAFVLVLSVWIALSIYALVKAIGSAPDDANPTAVLLIVVGLVPLLLLGLGATVGLIGKSMVERRRALQATAIEEVGL